MTTVSLEHEVVLEQVDAAMAEPFTNNASSDSGSSTGDQTSTGFVVHPGGTASEMSMWEEWTQASSAVGDEVSTSNFLPDLTTCSASSRLCFQQSDMLATWMSGFHPLSAHPVDDHQPSFMHDVGLAAHLDPEKLLHEVVENATDATDALPLVYESKTTGVSRQLLRALGPLSPSSPLAIHNGLLNPLGDPWDDGCPSSSSSLQWSTAPHTYSARSPFFPDRSATALDHLEAAGNITTPTTPTTTTTTTRSSFAPKPRHTDIFVGPNGTFESATPGGWTPQSLFDHHGSDMKVVPPMKLMASLREAGEVKSCDHMMSAPHEIGLVNLTGDDRCSTAVTSPAATIGSTTVTMGGMLETDWPGKHRLELVDGEVDVINGSPAPLLKRPKTTSVKDAKALQWSDQALRSYCGPASSGAGSVVAQAMDVIAIGPALNTNGKPRARRGSATDPQSVYARHRREKINERLKNLQNLVPNGAKVDIVTMLDEAIHYVQFLQNQVELLKSDDYWMYATPNNYNGMDLSEMSNHSQELESSA